MGLAFYFGPSAAREGTSWFCVNADDPPGQARAISLFGRRTASGLSIQGCTSALPDRGYAFLIEKAAGEYGGSAGINEAGVSIGTAAAYSSFKPDRGGIRQQDILRAALSGAGTAAEARDMICTAIEGGGQSGIRVAKSPHPANGIFLLADPGEAYILETAGRRWAWRRAESRDAISDNYSIEEDYKRLDTQTRKEIAPVNERAACSDEADPGRKGRKESWSARAERRSAFFTLRGSERREALREALGKVGDQADTAAILDTLRTHRSPGSEGVCRHGGIWGAATSFGLSIEYRPKLNCAVVWFSGGPYPCRSVFKPIVLREGSFVPLWNGIEYSEEPASGYEYWSRSERSARDSARRGNPAAAAVAGDAQREIMQATDAYLAGGSLDDATAAVGAAVARADTAFSGA